MTQLKSLTFTVLPKIAAADPVVYRRNKLILRLQQQVSLIQNPNFLVTHQRWIFLLIVGKFTAARATGVIPICVK